MADNKKNITNDVESLKEAAGNDKAISEKLDELIHLLSTTEIDSESAKIYKQKFDQAIGEADSYQLQLNAFHSIDDKKSASREELLDDFTILLSTHQFDSETAKTYIKGDRLSRIVLGAIGIVMIAMGFAMIIMPAPPYFEMFTIYYFNPDDGVTLMDLISLLIILVGVYLLIKAIFKNPIKRK